MFGGGVGGELCASVGGIKEGERVSECVCASVTAAAITSRLM